MKLPKMSEVERAVLAATFAREMDKRSAADNSSAEESLDVALWEVQCFRQAVRERKE